MTSPLSASGSGSRKGCGPAQLTARIGCHGSRACRSPTVATTGCHDVGNATGRYAAYRAGASGTDRMASDTPTSTAGRHDRADRATPRIARTDA